MSTSGIFSTGVYLSVAVLDMVAENGCHTSDAAGVV